MNSKPITIIGGGLAGLALGIGLRQRSIPVSVFEAGHYPRHRVCGEFISGRGQQTLARLGLREPLTKAGAIPAQTARFFSANARSAARDLAEPATAISRYILDAFLAGEFRRLGGELREGERWREGDCSEGAVHATGRRLQPVIGGCRWFGLKVHARKVPLSADLEMHFSPSSYVGICALADGEVNICGLFRRSAGIAETAQHWSDSLRGPAGSHLHTRLKDAVFDPDSFCSVAGLALRPQRAAASPECCIGDAITMIPPVTGNGMSMAFESAELAIEPLVDYSRGKMGWAEAQGTIARRCDERFASRLAWAGRVQPLLFRPRLQNALVRLGTRWGWAWRLLERKTR